MLIKQQQHAPLLFFRFLRKLLQTNYAYEIGIMSIALNSKIKYNINRKSILGVIEMIISATEAQNNLSKYYKIAETEAVYIERRGGILLKLEKADKSEFMKMKLERLHGCFSSCSESDFDKVKYERLVKKHGTSKTTD